jgi:hypothetical protein
MTLPDELVHFSLESKPGGLLRQLGHQGEGGPRIPLVACHLIRSCVPPYSKAAQLPAGGSRGQLVGISLGPPNVVRIF